MAFLDEIAGQGDALRDLVRFYRSQGRELLNDAEKMVTRRPRSLVFHGMGTSEYAALAVRDYLGSKTVIPVTLWEAGELLHYGMDGIRDDDVIIGVSQSGESVETRKVAELLRYHRQVISITNNRDSSMARWAALNLPILAGEESSISNKTYTNSMAALMLMSRAIAGDDWEFKILSSLEKIADEMDDFLANRQDEIDHAADFLREAKTLYFVSRGPAMAAAKQAALTFQEGARIFTTALPGGSMRHGPFEIAGPGHFTVFFAPDGHGGDLLRSMALEVAGLGSKVLLLTSSEVEKSENLASIVLSPGEPEFFPFTCAVPQELLLARMASDRGHVAGVFTRGEKITSRE